VILSLYFQVCPNILKFPGYVPDLPEKLPNRGGGAVTPSSFSYAYAFGHRSDVNFYCVILMYFMDFCGSGSEVD